MKDALFVRGRVTVVGVLNATPDSFSDGGRFVTVGGGVDLDAAVAAGLALVHEGVDVLDVGGESTRPGAAVTPAEIELARTVPLIERLAKATSSPISIDTRKAAVAAAALEAGASIVNDVSGLRFDPALAALVAERRATLIVGHMRGTPTTMQDAPSYDDVLEEVAEELEASLAIARGAGVRRERLVVDPGIGFGKRVEDNLALLANAGWLGERLGLPVLVGPSRKSFLGKLTGDPAGRRDQATIAACAVAVFAGADGLRVHDGAAGVHAARVALALREARRPAGVAS
ncbi:MAG TPA: dihydropteroate synthase [Myxococcota bacterium]|nr:dihydropteroate synthase [Myxococcota bacterium]